MGAETKLHIMELCLSPDLGGLELFVQKSVKAFSATEESTIILNERGRLKPRMASEEITSFSLPKRSVLTSWHSGRTLARLIDKNAIDVIHLHWTKDLPVAVWAKSFAKRRVRIVYSRHMTMTRFKDDFYHRWLYRHVDALHAVTEQVAEQLRRFIPESVRAPIHVVHPGATPLPECSAPERDARRVQYGLEGFAVVMAGRIEEAKGQYLLIDALAALQRSDVHIYFAGHAMHEGYEAELAARAEAQGVGAQVTFMGFVENVQQLFSAADAVVLATRAETFGLVLVEAMHAGCAVIGSNRGGVLEIIDDGETGLLFESGNADALATAIQKLYDAPDLRGKVAEAGRNKARECFNDPLQFQTLLEVLRSALTARR